MGYLEHEEKLEQKAWAKANKNNPMNLKEDSSCKLVQQIDRAAKAE